MDIHRALSKIGMHREAVDADRALFTIEREGKEREREREVYLGIHQLRPPSPQKSIMIRNIGRSILYRKNTSSLPLVDQ